MSGAPVTAGGEGGGDPPVLQGRELVVRYGDATVLDVDRVELRDGELVVVLGPNGAGKSTLMRVLAMLEEPTSGRVLHRGRAGPAAADRLRAVSTAVFQRPHLWSGTVADNVLLALRLAGVRGAEADARRASAVSELGLDGLLDREVDDLSAGQAQRVALARALAPGPEVLFLDEPTANLDGSARNRLRRDVDRVARRGGRSTLLITHDRREAFRLADRIVVLDAGRRVRTGTPQELYERPGSRYVARVSGAELSLHGRVEALPDDDRGEGTGAGGHRSAQPRPGTSLLRVDVGGVRLLAVGAARPGDEVAVAYRPEDLALARETEEEPSAGRDRPRERTAAFGDRAAAAAGPEEGPGSDASASGGTGADAEAADGREEAPGAGRDSVRNSFAATVAELRDVRGLVRVRLEGPPDVVAVVTRGSAEALDLRPGAPVRVRVKATALHAFPR